MSLIGSCTILESELDSNIWSFCYTVLLNGFVLVDPSINIWHISKSLTLSTFLKCFPARKLTKNKTIKNEYYQLHRVR